jgi:redox-sensing transcriptional repressor
MHSNAMPSHPSGQAKTRGRAEANGRFDTIGRADFGDHARPGDHARSADHAGPGDPGRPDDPVRPGADASRAGPGDQPAAGGQADGIPEATVARLPVYLRALYGLAERGISTVASEELAAAAGVNSAKLRKDLSHLGSYGIRGVGYDVEYLVYQVSRTLGLTQDWPVVIVGAGNLGRALANYGGFVSRGFTISAMLDSDAAIVGSRIAKLTVRHVDELESVVTRHKVAIGVIAAPAASAQAVCDRLVSAGVTSILNFAPVVLTVPEGVDVRKVDLSIELQILAFHAQRRSAGRPEDGTDEAERPHSEGPKTFNGRAKRQVTTELAAKG